MNNMIFGNTSVLLGILPPPSIWEVLFVSIGLLSGATWLFVMARHTKSPWLRIFDNVAAWFMLIVLGAYFLLPPVARVREPAARMESANNLKQIAMAIHTFHDAKKFLPSQAICDQDGKPLLSWRVAILPYIEHEKLYKEFHLDEPWDSPHNIKLLEKMPYVYAHPKAGWDSDTNRWGLTHYQAFVSKHGPGTAEHKGRFFTVIVADPRAQLTLKDITDADGTAHTFLVAEALLPVPWTAPMDLSDTPQLLEMSDLFGDEFQVLFADGTTRLISFRNMDETQFLAGVRANDGKSPPAP